MNLNSCDSCSDQDRAKRDQYDRIKTISKTNAIEKGKTQAICFDQATGFYTADAGEAIASGYIIKEFISNVQ